MDCRPGPPTVLTKSEEDEIVQYLIQMADMGYGLTREAVMHMHMVYVYVDKCRRDHPFKNETAGRWWFQGFKARFKSEIAGRWWFQGFIRFICPKLYLTVGFDAPMKKILAIFLGSREPSTAS